MLLLFPCFVCLLVHSYPLTIVAIPVTQFTTAITQTYEVDIEQTKTPVDSKILEMEKVDSKGSQFNSSTSGEEKEEEFQNCNVSNVTYKHREQIPRSDPCEICVCVDSEMFCLWKLCVLNSTTLSPAVSVSTANQITTKQSINDNNIVAMKLNETDVKMNEIDETNEKYSKILMNQRKYNVLKNLKAASSKNSMEMEKTTSEKDVITSTEPTVCYVMGVVYKYGEVLPRDTGTCLECSCSEGGRVTCNPKDCVSQPDLDYLSHNNNLDMFDIDTF